MAKFKNRGHFCNYCRVIIGKKILVSGCDLNPVIWNVWTVPDKRDEFIKELSELPEIRKKKEFTKILEHLSNKYGNCSKSKSEAYGLKEI